MSSTTPSLQSDPSDETPTTGHIPFDSYRPFGQFYDERNHGDSQNHPIPWGLPYFAPVTHWTPGSLSPMGEDVYRPNQQGQASEGASKSELELALYHPPPPSDPLRLGQIQGLLELGYDFSEGSPLAKFNEHIDPDNLLEHMPWVLDHPGALGTETNSNGRPVE
ncbi:hypothetical protein H4R33_006001 [Dimargaris cristalligena]|nr:hypothetical protein H4R33_006001 [Dimargaris cristalligena]